MAVRSAQEEIVDVAHGFAGIARNPNADADQFRSLLNVRGHVAGQKIIKRLGDRLRVHAFKRYLDPVHLNVEGVTCRNDAVFHFDYAANLRNGVGHLRRQRTQKFFVVRIKLDFDRLRHAGQVTDQIFHQL